MCYPIIIDEARLSLILSVICEFFGLIVQDASLRIQLIKNRSLPPAFDLDRLIWTADETLLSESTGKSHSKRSETSEMAFSERNQNANSQIESENSQIEDNVNYAKIEAELTNSNLDEDEMEEAEDKFRNLSHSLFHFAQCKVPFPLNLRSFLREWRYISEKRKRNMESEEEKCSEFQKDSEEFNTEQNIEDKRGGSEELTYEWGEKLLIAVTLLRHSLNPLNPLSDGSNISSEKIEKIAESVKEIIGGVNRQKQMQRPNRRKCSKQTNMKMNMKTDRKFNVSREEEEGDDDKEEIHKAMKFEEKEMKLITEKNNTENRNENKLYGGMMRMLLEVAIPETDENERKPFLELLKELCTNCKVNCNELHSFVRQTAEKIDKHSLKFTSTFRSSHEMQHQSRDLRMKCYSLQDRSSTETTTQQQTLTEQIPSFLKQLAPVTYAGITNPSSQCFMNAFVVQLFMHPQFRRTVISWRRCGTIQKLDEKIKEPEDFKQFSGKSHHSRFYADIVQKQHNRIRQFSSTKLETASAVMDALQIVFAQLEMKAYPFLFNTSDEETPEPHTEKEKKTETAASSTSTQTPQTSMGICSSSVSLDPLVLAYRDKADQQVDIRKQHDLREFGLRLLELLEIEAEVECEEARNFIEELFLGVRVTEQICCNSHRICHSEPFFFVDVAIGESTSLQEALEKERRGQKLKRLFCPICQKNQAKRLCMDKAEGEVKREKENTTEREEEEGGGEKEEKTNSRNFIKEKGDESKQPNGVGEGIVRCYLADVPNTLFFYLQRFQSDGIKAVKMDAHFEFPIYGLTISDYTKEEEEEEDDDDEGIEEKQQIDFDSTMNNSEQSSSSSPSSSSCNLDHTNTETKNKPLLKEIQNIGSDKQKAKSSSRDESYSVFDLVGVICHKGTINKGHYYSFAKEREAPFRWFKFNDHRVTVVAEEALKEECFGSTAHAQKKLRGTNISDSAHDMEDRADDKSSNAGNDSGFERLANKGKKRDFGAILLMYQRRHPINEWEQRETELIQKQFNRSFPSHETYTFLSPLLESLLFPLRIVKSSEDALNLLKNLKPQQQHYPILFHLTNQSLPAPLQLAVIPKLVRDACGINSFATVKRSINEMEEEIQENMPNEQFIQEIISDDFAELYKWICAKEEELAYLQQVKSRHSDLSYEDSIQQTSSQTSLEDRFKAECEHIQSSIMKTSSIVPLLCCFCELLFVEQSNMNSAFYHIFFNAEKAKRDAFLNMIHMLITKAVDECEKQNCELIGGKIHRIETISNTNIVKCCNFSKLHFGIEFGDFTLAYLLQTSNLDPFSSCCIAFTRHNS
ncbi:putative Ubiquitin carboxyl-terminal hydrolase [Monocercomonoides exilis]|uniref:putative Ubiquitin carboxyl-terminal hydrolase n=1 Tax=Monocercomonoides exilis TaxID=2049356 RepID=UPI0035598C7E|nr:putative Ubiquitin carboxyl-terminal hydrolase [Monocercomonoides exilis]|eukprot:MONOS_12180.1-p1 / transcript=MONOS_12180.1 / gene=MONOS_12180 / organism=Monocercomonoides_exilis_PA203 / gene_product=unspecified product / transcript_product=unspecified product / location=Mono_scaffold00656:29036-33406(-) / protein_length=1314 / sequence_SO=supercontig / SO=protein_coding / is_pseudo=false